MQNKIYVTQPSLAPLEEYNDLLQDLWDDGILTHHGPRVQKLEKKLKEYLHIDNCTIVTNGTIAIQLAIKALSFKRRNYNNTF